MRQVLYNYFILFLFFLSLFIYATKCAYYFHSRLLPNLKTDNRSGVKLLGNINEDAQKSPSL